MKTLDPEKDQRTLSLHDWAELRYIQDQCRKNTLDERIKAEELAEAFEKLFRECRRLRSITERQYLDGFNDGYDKCMEEAQSYVDGTY